MKIRRNDSYDTYHFFKLKELYFFKLLLDQYDLSLVKDYLRKSLDIIVLKRQVQIELDQSNYTYIMSEQAELFINQTQEKVIIKQGRQIQQNILSFKVQSEILIYRVQRKTVLVLETLYFLEIPFLKNMKSHEKFSFLQNCELITLNYNSFVYRKGDSIDAVYFLIEGQIKMYKQINQKVFQVSSLECKRIFGLFEIKSALAYRQLYAKSNVNNVRILKMPIKLIDAICAEQQITIVEYITNVKSQLHSMVKNELNVKELIRNSEKQNNVRTVRYSQNLMNKKEFEKKLKIFEVDRNINNLILNKMVQSRKLIMRVKQLNLKIQNQIQRDNHQPLTTVYAIKHYNDKWKKQKDKKNVNGHSNLDFTRIQQSRTYPINGLLKYPAYQRYLASRQQVSRNDYSIPITQTPNRISSIDH